MTKTARKYAPLGMPSARPFRIDGRTKEAFLVAIHELPPFTNGELHRIGITSHAHFGGEEAVCLTKRELKSFMHRTGLCVAKRFGSHKPGAEWVRFVRKSAITNILTDAPLEIPPPIEVVDYWDGVDEDVFVSIIGQILGPVLKRKIIVSVPHREHRPYNPEGAFRVFIWSTPEKNTKLSASVPMNLFNIETVCRDDAYDPRPEESLGILINDGVYAAAELFPNALYIHHDLVHRGYASEKKLMAVLCKKAADILKETRNLEALLSKIQARHDARQRELFCKMVEAGLLERTYREKTALDALREKVQEARKRYISAARELLCQEEQLLNPERIKEKFEKEILKIQDGQMKLIEPKSIVFGESKNTLTVQTKPIIAYDRWTKKYHLRGKYEINLNLEKADIRFFNIDNPGKSDAHIDPGSGQPCLGNIESDMTDYLTHYEVGAAITLGIAFLESPDSRDCSGTYIRDYPIVPKPKEIK